MLVTAIGSLMLSNEAHFSKASSPMDIRAAGRSIFFSIVHSWKALVPIFFTEAGRVMTRRALHFINVLLSISGIMPLITTLSRSEQPSKALLPTLFTILGMMASCKLLQSMKASEPIFVRAEGSSISVRLWHFSKALLPMVLMDVGRPILLSVVQP